MPPGPGPPAATGRRWVSLNGWRAGLRCGGGGNPGPAMAGVASFGARSPPAAPRCLTPPGRPSQCAPSPPGCRAFPRSYLPPRRASSAQAAGPLSTHGNSTQIHNSGETRRGDERLAVVYLRAVDRRGGGTRGDWDSSDGGKNQKAPLRCYLSRLAHSLRMATAHRYTTAVKRGEGTSGSRWCICGRSIGEEGGRGETGIAATAGRARRRPLGRFHLPLRGQERPSGGAEVGECGGPL